MAKKKNIKIWKVKDMLEYALKKYALKTDINNYTGSVQLDTYKRDIRRKLVDCNLVKKDENKKEYIHELPEEIAKAFIDTTMKDYFTDSLRLDNDKVNKRFSEQDKKLNEDSFAAFIETAEYERECFEKGINPYDFDLEITDEEIENRILKIMIQAIFSKFYDFKEKEYIKDYKQLKSLINTNDYKEPLQNGYSLLKDKLDNPIKNYCTPKN